MPVLSFAEFRAATALEFDLVIVGSGPAGLSIAHAFRNSRFRVAILESGGIEPARATEALNEIVSVGERRADPELVRRRCVGGTSTIWTGRCGMFDAIDYARRDWLPLSGWPIDGDDLAGQVRRAGELLGLMPNLSGEHALRDLRQPFDREGWNAALLSPALWQFSSRDAQGDILHFADENPAEAEGLAILRHSGRKTPVDFGRAHIGWLRESGSVFLVTHATVQEVLTTEGARQVSGLLLRGPDGEGHRIAASRVVLACGGIDNARLLLASRGSLSVGLGNGRDQVGRYLTDHTFSELGSFGPGAAGALRRRLGTRLYQTPSAKQVYCFGLRLSPALQRREGLMNASVHLVEFGARGTPLSDLAAGLRAVLRDRDLGAGLRSVGRGLGQPAALAGNLADRFVHRRSLLSMPERTVMGAVVEQQLDPESRVRLAARTDRFGMPLAEIDWRFNEVEYRTARRFREIMREELARLGMEAGDPPPWDSYDSWKATLTDLAHPMCTTRMSEDPATGVVDANCQVHGVEGLFVAGSSVFATAGHMNPTQMIVALALRLADHLNAAMSSGRAEAAPLRPKLRVGIIGTDERVLSVYAPVLDAIRERVEVVGLAAPERGAGGRIAQGTGWRVFDEPSHLVAEGAADFVIVAVPPGENDGVYPRMAELGRPLFLETPFCWDLGSGRRLLQRLRKARLTVGVAEPFPFMPQARLMRKVVDLGAIGVPATATNDLEHYDYHGIARLRRTLGLWDEVVSVTARREEVPGAGARIEEAVFAYGGGATLRHRFLADDRVVAAMGTAEFRVAGDEGALADDVTGFRDNAPVPGPRRIVDGRGELVALAFDGRIGPVLWRNPFAGSGLDDEQIAVASLLMEMADAVAHGGSPAYDAADGLFDVEMMAAMRASADRGGRRVRIGIPVLREKVIGRLRRVLRA